MTGDLRKLLGGYASDTLSEDERKALFEAALTDQELFEALANEHALKELLDDPAARAELLRATQEPHFSVFSGFREWFEKPVAKVLVATGLVLLVAIGLSTLREVSRRTSQQEGKNEVALSRVPPPPSAAVPLPAPVPKTDTAPLPRAKRVTAIESKPPETPLADSSAEPAAASAALPSQPVGSPAPAAKMAEALARTAEQGDTRLTYALFVRGRNGESHPVSPDTLLQPSDALRLELRANQPGYLSVTAGSSRVLFAGYVDANKPRNVPETGWFTAEKPESRTLQLAFTQMNAQLVRSFEAQSKSTFRNEEERRQESAKAPAAGTGAVGGVLSSAQENRTPTLSVAIPLKYK